MYYSPYWGNIVKHNNIQPQDYIILIEQQKLYWLDQSPWTPLEHQYIDDQLLEDVTYIPVGLFQGRQCYAVALTNTVADHALVNLRSQMHLLNADDYLLASRSLQLVTWYQQHRYCGRCGQPMHYDSTESAMACHACGLISYPRISPCMMCLVTRGEECLLAHHHRHTDNMYATLAGFVEAGESLEQTVHREIMEEVGLTVNKLRYFSSQSWPFPHQLMVAYFAEYQSGDICVDGEEIIDAQWFHYTELPLIPPPTTLSGQLIHHFVQQQHKHQTR